MILLQKAHPKNPTTKYPQRLSARLLNALLMLAIVLISGCSQQPRIAQASVSNSIMKFDTITAAEISALEQQVKQSPNNAELYYKLGLAYVVDAEKNKSPHSRELAIKNFRQVLKRVPGNPATLKLLYNIYYEDIVAGNDQAFAKASHIFNQLSSTTQAEVNAPSLAVFLQRYLAQKKIWQQQ